MDEEEGKEARHMAKREELEEYLRRHWGEWVEDLLGWLRIASISTLPEHRLDVAQAAAYGAEQLEGMGMRGVEVIETGGHPLVYGEWCGAVGKPTVLYYGHYDVQPVEPLEDWESAPFAPEIRDGKIFGRGASDDKGQVMTVFKAMQTLLQTEGGLPINVKVLLEGEEETSGAALAHYIWEHAGRLGCDGVLICDTAMPAAGVPGLICGLRGIVYLHVELSVEGGEGEGGRLSGVAADALHGLCVLLSRLKSEEGTIQIAGLSEPRAEVSEEERAFWREDSLGMGEGMRAAMGVEQCSGEGEYGVLERLWGRPSLEVHGIEGGWMKGGGKTVLARRAAAKISLRFPPPSKQRRCTRRSSERLGRRYLLEWPCESS